MKRLIIILIILLSFTVLANAELIDNGDGTITDTNTNLMWLQDLDYARTVDYAPDGSIDYRLFGTHAIEFAENLDFAGYNDWRLPSAKQADGSPACDQISTYCPNDPTNEFFILWEELGNESSSSNQFGPFINEPSITTFWTGTIYERRSSNQWFFQWSSGRTGHTSYMHSNFNVMIVRDCGGPCPTATVVPEPVSSILFITGGTLLAGRRYFKRIREIS